jgi:hypothetical protein
MFHDSFWLKFWRRLWFIPGIFIIHTGFSQLSYNRPEVMNYKPTNTNYFSTIAYKIPFRGDNYKFYGTFSYHILGRAFAGKQVHNTIVAAYRLAEDNCPNVEFKVLKSSGNTSGRIVPSDKHKNGFYAVFMTPLLVGNKPMKHYCITGFFRFFVRYDKEGSCSLNKSIEIDFESTAQHLLNLDNAAKIYGLCVKKVIISRFLLDDIYTTESGKFLKEREIYFPKFLSRKVNRKFDDLYYVEFGFPSFE